MVARSDNAGDTPVIPQRACFDTASPRSDTDPLFSTSRFGRTGPPVEESV